MLVAIVPIGALHCTAPLPIALPYNPQTLPGTLWSYSSLQLFHILRQAVKCCLLYVTAFIQYGSISSLDPPPLNFWSNTYATPPPQKKKNTYAAYLCVYFQSTIVKICILCPCKNSVPFHLVGRKEPWIYFQRKSVASFLIPHLLIWQSQGESLWSLISETVCTVCMAFSTWVKRLVTTHFLSFFFSFSM